MPLAEHQGAAGQRIGSRHAVHTYSASHEFLSDIPSAARIGRPANSSGKSIVADGSFVEAIVLYADTGTAGSSRLIMFQDTGVTGLPLTPDGADVQINVDAAGWFIL